MPFTSGLVAGLYDFSFLIRNRTFHVICIDCGRDEIVCVGAQILDYIGRDAWVVDANFIRILATRSSVVEFVRCKVRQRSAVFVLRWRRPAQRC